MSSQQTHSSGAYLDGNEAEVDVVVEDYEGEEVAIHVRDSNADEGVSPWLSMYLSPVDAAIHAERIIAAARSLDPVKVKELA
jgi:hypothetical protein